MTHLPASLSLSVRQRGVVSVAIAMVLMFILAAAVTSMMKVSGSSVVDAAKSEEQVSALFLAESGLERAQATLRAAAVVNTYNNTSCTSLTTQPGTVTLGRGSFTYVSAESTPTTCNNNSLTPCTKCVVTVRGNVGATSSRTVKAEMVANRTDGVTGQTNSTPNNAPNTANTSPNITLNLKVATNNSFTFTHLIYNPTTNWGGDQFSPVCQNVSPGVSLTDCTQSWLVPGNYYNNPTSVGTYAPVPTAGTYSITQALNADLPSSDTRRNYALGGVIFGPSGGTIAHEGSFARSPDVSPPCESTTDSRGRTQPITANCSSWDYQRAFLPAANVSSDYWTCNPNSGTTPDWSRAGSSNILIFGFGGKPFYMASGWNRTTAAQCPGWFDASSGRCKNRLSGVLVNGQPIHRQLSVDGTVGDFMYSQIWYIHNKSYYASTAGASSGAIFTGAVGARVTGSISGNTLTVTAVLNGRLSKGDTLSSTGGGTNVRDNAGSCPTTPGAAACTQITSVNPDGTYTVSGATQTVGSRTITARSNVLRVTAMTALDNTSSGVLSDQDIVASAALGAGRTISYTTSSVTGGTTAGTGALPIPGTTEDYLLSGTQQTISNGDAQTNQQSSGKYITVYNATGTAPSAGTAVSVVTDPATTGQFYPDSVLGYIGGTTLNVTSIPTNPTQVNGTNLSVGDALFGADVALNTTITALGSGSGGTGTYTITPSQAVGTSASPVTIVARAAVVSGTVNSFTVSRRPDTRLSNARLCGGLCPVLLTDGTTGTGNHAPGQVNFTNLVNYDDWSSGFACVSGADPSNIETVTTIMSKQGNWTEVVQ